MIEFDKEKLKKELKEIGATPKQIQEIMLWVNKS